MRIKKIFPRILLGVLVLVFSFVAWAWNSPIVQDYYLIHQRDTEFDLAFAFAVSLRNNHPAAYDMVDPSLNSRLDEWMNVHEGKHCTRWADTVLGGKGTERGYKIFLDCFGENKWLWFTVDNIVIKDMKVIDWGAVEEK